MGIDRYLGVARAPFLLLPVTLVAAGAGAAALAGRVDPVHSILALVGLVALHAAVNIFNEVSDMRTGIDLKTVRTPFSGGSGTLPSGALSERAAFVFGVCASTVGLAVGTYFTILYGWPMVPLVAVGGVAVLGYTDILARVGLGEAFAGLGLGALPVWGTAFVQSGSPGPAAVAAAIPAFFMTFNLLLLNEFPDEEADRTGGRLNLVIALGRRQAARVWATAAILTPTSIVLAVGLNVLPSLALVATLPTLALVPGLRRVVRAPQSAVPLPELAANVIWNLATNAFLAIALAIAAT